MRENIRRFTQSEYTRVLDNHNAHVRGLSQGDCEKILMDHGASYGQAKNGAYVYIHHRSHLSPIQRGSQDKYDQLLDDFGARQKRQRKCVEYLESLGYTYGQAKSAVYNYRVSRGLIGKKPSL